ncbi:MAG TPA: deoxyribose-phosphate aldolase [Fimbriimonadaceae bacterium]|nr:deoxyribose-phosphate aldolase [Fimbriimonadaceae bacterium]
MTRNLGSPLDLDWIEGARGDDREPGQSRAAPPDALTLAVHCMDLTSLNDNDTPEIIQRLCEKARSAKPASVCVFHRFVPEAVAALGDAGIPVASVAGGFPSGYPDLADRLEEIRQSVASGADEIDAVITRSLALESDWVGLYDEIRFIREAAGPAVLKVILAAGDLAAPNLIARASLVAMMAGADFVKTSTGREKVNATWPIGRIMTRSVRDYAERTGFRVGFKPAGGIRTAKDAVGWIELVATELGDEWLDPRLFRIGASSLLADIERALSRTDLV